MTVASSVCSAVGVDRQHVQVVPAGKPASDDHNDSESVRDVHRRQPEPPSPPDSEAASVLPTVDSVVDSIRNSLRILPSIVSRCDRIVTTIAANTINPINPLNRVP